MYFIYIFTGNDNLHYLSTQANYRLIVILEDWENETRYAVYDSFRVGDENSFYFMTVQGYSGDAGTMYKYFLSLISCLCFFCIAAFYQFVPFPQLD